MVINLYFHGNEAYTILRAVKKELGQEDPLEKGQATHSSILRLPL